ncbi:MAG: hypothetical protein JWR19_3471 [Pedosphaera sp.]|nr:hypothetical protein [Pedosphaera sp.]
MQATLNKLAKAYFFSAWLPSALALTIFGLFFANGQKVHIPFIDLALLLALAGSLLGILISGIVQFKKGRKLWGALNLLALPLIGLLVFWGLGFLLFDRLFSEEPDNFGKNIVIPADMKVSDPVESFNEPGEPAADELTESIIAAFATNSGTSGSPKISTDLAILNEFATTKRQKLIEYLSASPRWLVTEEEGKPYAYRRLVIGGRWQNTLNGFYSSFEVAPSPEPNFQTRVVIGFDGPVFAEPFAKILTTAQVGIGDVPIRVVDDKAANQGKESYVVLQSARASVEIFEQSRLDARPATRLALAEIKHELEMALISTNLATLSPWPGAESGEPVIQLAKGMQGGIYQVRAFVNPGEAGRAYIKVFEATQNTPLSADRIKPGSICRIGWSTNSNEPFRYQSELTVYEGDWGNFYPGRFELWFIPDSGKPERKLVERIFRIEGWMR